MSKTLLANYKVQTFSDAEEADLLEAWFERGDAVAREKLIMSLLPMIIKIVRRYPLKSGIIEYDDLLGVGIIGATTALKGFDRSNGARFAHYAKMFIVAAVNDYVIDNCEFGIGKIATTKQMRRIFWRVRHASKDGKLSRQKILDISKETGVPFDYVNEIHKRIHYQKLSDEDVAESHTDAHCDFTEDLIDQDWFDKSLGMVIKSKSKLDKRRETIIEDLHLIESPKTKTELAKTFGISVERVRQLENDAISFIKEDVSNVTRLL